VAVSTRHRTALAGAGDLEFLPLLDALTAFSLLLLGRPDAAATAARTLAASVSTSSGARSFPAWVRAEVLAADEPSEALAAHREYGLLVSRARWTARLGVLAAARSKIAGERLTADHARLSRDVMLDPLTGLSNRRAFDDWLEDAPAHARATALLLIDMDSFKEINDEHGHAVGDEVLRRVGAVLSSHVRTGDLALRLGGDEFAVVLRDEQVDGDDLAAALDAFHTTAVARAAAIREAVWLHDWDQVVAGLRVGVSIGVGVATVGPQLPGAADLLYREADARLYVAKSERGNPLDEVLLPWPR
jgi:diguanylate cyclase (GGDEF)-like protein